MSEFFSVCFPETRLRRTHSPDPSTKLATSVNPEPDPRSQSKMPDNDRPWQRALRTHHWAHFQRARDCQYRLTQKTVRLPIKSFLEQLKMTSEQKQRGTPT